MAFKVAFLAALCVAQAVNAFRVANIAALDDDKNITKNIITACFKDQQGAFEKFAEEVAKAVNVGLADLDPALREKIQSQIDLIAEPLETITNTLREFPSKMHDYLKDGQLKEAAEVIMDTRSLTAEKRKVINDAMEQMIAEVPESEEEITELAKEINHQFKFREKVVRDSMAMCVYMGGSYRP